MIKETCVLKRNITTYVDRPNDKDLNYLKVHLESCKTCQDQYKFDLNRSHTFVQWIPDSIASKSFITESNKENQQIASSIFDIVSGNDLKKEFKRKCLSDFFSLFKRKEVIAALFFVTSFVIYQLAFRQ